MDGRVLGGMTGPDRERTVPLRLQHAPHGSRAVTQLYDDILRPSGLRVTQFSILGAVARLARRICGNSSTCWPSTRRRSRGASTSWSGIV